MTLPKNFPGRKHQRRVGALERIEIRLNTIPATPVNAAKIRLLKREQELLEARTRTGGKKSTKKVGSNTGRM